MSNPNGLSETQKLIGNFKNSLSLFSIEGANGIIADA
jgi:hypothetical protein